MGWLVEFGWIVMSLLKERVVTRPTLQSLIQNSVIKLNAQPNIITEMLIRYPSCVNSTNIEKDVSKFFPDHLGYFRVQGLYDCQNGRT